MLIDCAKKNASVDAKNTTGLHLKFSSWTACKMKNSHFSARFGEAWRDPTWSWSKPLHGKLDSSDTVGQESRTEKEKERERERERERRGGGGGGGGSKFSGLIYSEIHHMQGLPIFPVFCACSVMTTVAWLQWILFMIILFVLFVFVCGLFVHLLFHLTILSAAWQKMSHLDMYVFFIAFRCPFDIFLRSFACVFVCFPVQISFVDNLFLKRREIARKIERERDLERSREREREI